MNLMPFFVTFNTQHATGARRRQRTTKQKKNVKCKKKNPYHALPVKKSHHKRRAMTKRLYICLFLFFVFIYLFMYFYSCCLFDNRVWGCLQPNIFPNNRGESKISNSDCKPYNEKEAFFWIPSPEKKKKELDACEFYWLAHKTDKKSKVPVSYFTYQPGRCHFCKSLL